MHIHTAPYHRELRKRRKSVKLPFGAQRFLAILEGVEGGFAIGAGLVAGLSFTTVNRKVLLTTAIISLLVSGFNSAAVKYSSEHYADELDGREKRNHVKHYLVPAAYEFGAYAIISFLTLLPLLFFTNSKHAAIWCTLSTLVTLFIAGYWRGYLMRRRNKHRDGLEVMLLGAAIIAIGTTAGYVLHHFA